MISVVLSELEYHLHIATLGKVVIFFNITYFVEPYYLQKGEKYEDIQIEL